jgi:hypothetical protein
LPGDFAHPKPAKPEPNRIIIARGYLAGEGKGDAGADGTLW